MEFSELYKMLVKEMSAPWPDYSNPVKSTHRKWEECKYKSKKIKGFLSEQFGEVDVFLCVEQHSSRFFFFIKDNLWGTVEVSVLRNNGIQIRETLKCNSLGLYMSDVFKDFLLENFSYILSDSYHTSDGFSVYRRLAKDPSIKFTVIDSNTDVEITLENPEDLENYYGRDKQNFIYKIQKK
jgi:hypothetical protein